MSHGRFSRTTRSRRASKAQRLCPCRGAGRCSARRCRWSSPSAGQAGQMLSPNPCWATLPITMMVVGSMLTANPLSALMQRFGRRAGFVVGRGGRHSSGRRSAPGGCRPARFALFLLGALLTGIYMSANGFYRFAAADTASVAFRPKAISWVMAGGLLSAIVGPQPREGHGGIDGGALPRHLSCRDGAERRGRVPVRLARYPKAAARTGGTRPRAEAAGSCSATRASPWP